MMEGRLHWSGLADVFLFAELETGKSDGGYAYTVLSTFSLACCSWPLIIHLRDSNRMPKFATIQSQP